jgi:DNA processing protein
VIRSLSEAERTDWLRLARTEGVGPVTFSQLIARYGNAASALQELPRLARRGGRGESPALPTVAEVDAELAAGAALGARLICACEPDYSAALAAVDPPPPVIWALGRVELLGRASVAVVGARAASAAGQRFARGLAVELGAEGLTIVSGLARGIDAAAHQGALPTGTVAVVGGGVDDVFPSENAELYRRIAEAGCVVSERPPGHRAQARDFPRRNRIISGLSRAIVVVEAEIRSGSLITARLANEQGREVLAVPGSPLDPRARGANDLIRQGATLCEGASDVLRALEGLGGFQEPTALSSYEPAPDLGPDDEARALCDRICALLSPTPVSQDEIARAAGVSAAQAGGALIELALAGRAQLLTGGMVIAC